MAPHDLNLIQGEVLGVATSPWCSEACRWSLAYNTEVGLTMRQARQKWQQASAFSRHMLRAAMDSPSFDNLERLLHDYPDHAIEFSTFRRPVGVLNENTIFWEVRYY